MPPRAIQTGLGPIQVARPRVNDERTDADGNRIRFTSKILPPYLRRTKALDELVPWLYIKGISTGDFPEALDIAGRHKRKFRFSSPRCRKPAPGRLRAAIGH